MFLLFLGFFIQRVNLKMATFDSCQFIAVNLMTMQSRLAVPIFMCAAVERKWNPRMAMEKV